MKSSQELHKEATFIWEPLANRTSITHCSLIGAKCKGFSVNKVTAPFKEGKKKEETKKPAIKSKKPPKKPLKNTSLLEQIKGSIKAGQSIIVQIEKEEREREKKGAALTTNITLPGSSLVNAYNTGGGAFQKLITLRDQMKAIIDALNNPKQYSIVIRTAGLANPSTFSGILIC